MDTSEIIGIKDLALDVGSGTLLEHVTFSFGHNLKIAIVGANGSGKSTLLKAMADMVEPIDGKVVRKKDSLIEYVPQFMPEELKTLTLIEALLMHLEQRRPYIEEWKAYDILTRFGFSQAVVQQRLETLSGGEANRLMLARALLVEPDFLLLDEPTNHLDIEATVRFERLLCDEVQVPFCIVSHDRELLDRTTKETLFIRDKKLYYFGYEYTRAKEAFVQYDEAQRQKSITEGKEIARLEASADKMENWVKMNSKFATRYQNIRRRVESLKDHQIELSREKKRDLSLAPVELRVKTSLRIETLTIERPDSSLLFTVKNLSVNVGDRIAIMGKNGAGKSTFLKLLVRRFGDSTDDIRFNPQTKLGVFDQELADLPLHTTPFEYVSGAVKTSDATIRQGLIASGVPYARHHEKVKTFSGGERARIVFLMLRLSQPNLLILDEPTNHIDVQGIEDLEQQLSVSGASVIMVSHDRRFVEQTADRFFAIHNKELIEVADLDEYYASLSYKENNDDEDRVLERIVAIEAQIEKIGGKQKDLLAEELRALYQLFK